MKKKNVILTLLCCLLYCVTAFAANNTTIEKAIGIQNASDIMMVCIENEQYSTIFHVVDKSEIQQLYHKLINTPVEKTTDTTDIWGKGFNGWYSVRLYQKEDKLIKEFYVSGDMIFTQDNAFFSGSNQYGKENEFCKYIKEIEKTKQKYFGDLKQNEIYNNEVIVEYEKLNYKWGKPYFNQKNQLMVPFQELNTALNTQASYDVKTQLVSIRRGEPTPLYGEVTDEIVYVPVKALAEMADYHIYWDEKLKTALLTKNNRIELWNQRNLYPPQTHIETQDFTVDLPDTITYEKDELEDNSMNLYRVNTPDPSYIGRIKKYTDDDKDFDFLQQQKDGKIGTITSHFLNMMGMTHYITEFNIDMMAGSSKYADMEIGFGREDFDEMYYFFVNGKDIYVFYFRQNEIDREEQQKILSTFQYNKN